MTFRKQGIVVNPKWLRHKQIAKSIQRPHPNTFLGKSQLILYNFTVSALQHLAKLLPLVPFLSLVVSANVPRIQRCHSRISTIESRFPTQTSIPSFFRIHFKSSNTTYTRRKWLLQDDLLVILIIAKASFATYSPIHDRPHATDSPAFDSRLSHTIGIERSHEYTTTLSSGRSSTGRKRLQGHESLISSAGGAADSLAAFTKTMRLRNEQG